MIMANEAQPKTEKTPQTKNIKNVAKEAKQRLKQGFWQDYQQNLQGELARAKEEGLNESKVERYYAGKISGSIKGESDDDFYLKVKELLLCEGEVSDAIGRLTDKEYFSSLSYDEKQRYTFNLSERYLKALEKFKREYQYELKESKMAKNK
jgi:hypothetical protein